MDSKRDPAFIKKVVSFYKKEGRHALPWRKTSDPYAILVSEIMLQQTQVDRVLPKYEMFLERFPSTRALALAKLGEVLKVWSGLGYNRRAKYLHDCAITIEKRHGGVFPHVLDELRTLPGVGEYTANAVVAFAYNKPAVLLETNIRNVFTDHFFRRKNKVTDASLKEYIIANLPKRNVRTWYWALMDYGAHLKKIKPGLNVKSAHYIKQSKFRGSNRELRGKIISMLQIQQQTIASIAKESGRSAQEVRRVASTLLLEGMVKKNKRYLRLP